MMSEDRCHKGRNLNLHHIWGIRYDGLTLCSICQTQKPISDMPTKKPKPPKQPARTASGPLKLDNDPKTAPHRQRVELAVTAHDAFPLAQLYYDYGNARNQGNELHIDDIEPDIIASIRDHGVINPLNIRVVSMSDRAIAGIPNEFTHLTFGGNSRRCVALHLGLLTVPVRDFGKISAELAAELADLDNCQRTDIKPTERARVMARLVAEHGWKWFDDKDPANSIAHKFNMGRSNAFAYMRLANAPVLVAQAVDSGAISKSVAGLLLGIFDHKALKEAIEIAISDHWTDQIAAETIARRYKTQLKGAPWTWEKGEDQDLVPGVGSCAKCPYRSGNQADFIEGRGDICGNPSCWRDKSQAQFALTAKAHEKAGGRVMSTKDAVAAGLEKHYTTLSPHYVQINEPFTFGDFTTKGKPLSHFIQPAAADLILAIANDSSARHYWLLSSSKAIAMFTKSGHVKPQTPEPKDTAAAKNKDGIRRNQQALDAVARKAIAAISASGRVWDFRLAVRLILANASESTRKALPGLLGLDLKLTADEADSDTLDLQLRITHHPEHWLAAMIMHTSIYHSGPIYEHIYAADARMLAQDLGLDLPKELALALSKGAK